MFLKNVIFLMKRNYQPSKKRRKKIIGFFCRKKRKFKK
ncbi:50S ribosomal subunit protein L34 [Candidatus Vidania fulgoroideae]|uniref:50S ribosomal subunit protein L34 n=1 Tax=Candidatus Vidania fulgoroideorum TaxID=881286 RepID=A0A346E0L2_9PROT|nr:50S ribosomal subunit protein L34 [Candidatus Vidania fulgoroideae]